MANIIAEKHTDTTYTVELTQKELNTLVHLAGRLNERLYLEGMTAYTAREELLSFMEVNRLYRELSDKTTYFKMV